MAFPILVDTTSYTKLIFIPDPASTDGSGKTGLVAADLTVSYTRVETDNDVVITDVTGTLNNLAALTDAYNAWGLKEVSNTLAPGLYRLDIGDAVFVSGAWTAVVYIMITTSAAAATPIEFDLVQDVETVINNINAKTAQMTFTVANQIDANIQYVNDTLVTGDGSVGTPWGP